MAKVLIVDDHPANRLFLVTLLGYAGHDLLEAADGAAALEIVHRERPDLVVTDILMPTMDGFEFTRRLRAAPEIAATKIIFYTATYRESEARNLAKDCGVETVLSKPADPEVILDTVNSALGLADRQCDEGVPQLPVSPEMQELRWMDARIASCAVQLRTVQRALQAASVPRKCPDAGDTDALWDKFSGSLASMQRLSSRLTTIVETTLEVTPKRDLAQVVSRFFTAACAMIDAPFVAVGIIDPISHELKHIFAKGFDPEICRRGPLDLPESLMTSWASRRMQSADAGQPLTGLPREHPPVTVFLGAPVSARGRMNGWIYFAAPAGTAEFTVEDEHTAAMLAAELSLIYENAVMYDMLQRHAAGLQVEAAESERILGSLRLRDRALEAISQGITITDLTGAAPCFIYANPAFIKMTGYPSEEIIGQNPAQIIDLGSYPDIVERVSVARARKHAIQFETNVPRRDKSTFLDCIRLSPILNTAGDITHFVTTHEDITATRKSEQMLREAQKMETVGQLTGGVAHDFNNLLAVIKTNAEDLRDYVKMSPDYAEQADMVLQAATRGAELVQRLLTFSRKQELHPQVSDINAILESFSKLLGRTLQENIEIKIHRASRLPFVYLDPGLLENALLNLAVNARDAMPGGGTLTIETSIVKLDAAYASQHAEVMAGPYVLLAVSDTGEGMPQDIAERAFEPFFTTKEIGKGTGLGLSMVYGFVKQSGGHAKIYSEPGIGTTVKIYLPPTVQAAATAAEADTTIALPLTGSGSILLVEDDDLLRVSVGRKLTRFGYTVTEVSTAADAIARLENNPGFDLVFSDVIMPGAMTGADLVRQVQSRWPAVKLLLTSGYTAAAVAGKVKIPPDVALLSKPYSNADLVSAVRVALDEVAA